MTSPAASPQPARRALWVLWATLLAMLLALQASAGAIRPAALAETGAVAAKLTLPAPLAAQIRETGHALKAAAQRPNAVKPQDGHGGTPPLHPRSTTLPADLPAAPTGYTFPEDAGRGDSTAEVYRARAPPYRA